MKIEDLIINEGISAGDHAVEIAIQDLRRAGREVTLDNALDAIAKSNLTKLEKQLAVQRARQLDAAQNLGKSSEEIASKTSMVKGSDGKNYALDPSNGHWYEADAAGRPKSGGTSPDPKLERELQDKVREKGKNDGGGPDVKDPKVDPNTPKVDPKNPKASGDDVDPNSRAYRAGQATRRTIDAVKNNPGKAIAATAALAGTTGYLAGRDGGNDSSAQTQTAATSTDATQPAATSTDATQTAATSTDAGGIRPQDVGPSNVAAPADLDSMKFADAWKYARAKAGGAGGVFTWNGNQYQTNAKGEKYQPISKLTAVDAAAADKDRKAVTANNTSVTSSGSTKSDSDGSGTIKNNNGTKVGSNGAVQADVRRDDNRIDAANASNTTVNAASQTLSAADQAYKDDLARKALIAQGEENAKFKALQARLQGVDPSQIIRQTGNMNKKYYDLKAGDVDYDSRGVKHTYTPGARGQQGEWTASFGSFDDWKKEPGLGLIGPSATSQDGQKIIQQRQQRILTPDEQKIWDKYSTPPVTAAGDKGVVSSSGQTNTASSSAASKIPSTDGSKLPPANSALAAGADGDVGKKGTTDESISDILKLSGQRAITERDFRAGITQVKERMTLSESKSINECGPMGGMDMGRPASLNISAGSAGELADLIKLIGGIESSAHSSMAEPIMAVVSSDSMNDEMAMETYDNTPEEKVFPYDPNQFSHIIQKVRKFAHQPDRNTGANPMAVKEAESAAEDKITENTSVDPLDRIKSQLMNSWLSKKAGQ
jgi:hypothetical protein